MPTTSPLSVSVRVAPSANGPAVTLAVRVADPADGSTKEAGLVTGPPSIRLLAELLLWHKLNGLRGETGSPVTERHFRDDLRFGKAWDQVKNVLRSQPTVRAGMQLSVLAPVVKAKVVGGKSVVEVDGAALAPRAVTFSVAPADGNGASADVASEAALASLADYFAGRCTFEQLGFGRQAQSRRCPSFHFGKLDTRTTVVHRFSEGLHCNYIRCVLAEVDYGVPPEIELLVTRANELLATEAPDVVKVPDLRMLAPCKVQRATDDLEELTISFALEHSSYRYYAAFAFADVLAEHDASFTRLAEFVHDVPRPHQPSPATCSLGVRVLVETRDRRFIVAHRSNAVKMNPDVWSVSANEGVRQRLLRPGVDASSLLRTAVEAAARDELKLSHAEFHPPLLLSIYRNHFNQWGAGFVVRTDLTSDEVIHRHPSATEHWEHHRLAAVPVDVPGCGRAMRELGSRWYGGALETICAALAWRETSDTSAADPAEVAAELSKAAGDGIVPIDEVNRALLPESWNRTPRL